MEEMDIRTLSEGKYAIQRKNVLKDHFPAAYQRMQMDGTLEEHLAYTQESVSNYVDICAERYKQTEEYKQTEPMEAMRLLNMTVLEAEEAAYRSWIAIDEYEEEEDDE